MNINYVNTLLYDYIVDQTIVEDNKPVLLEIVQTWRF